MMQAPGVRLLRSIPADRGQWLTRLPALARGAAIGLGALHTWAAITQYSMNADGIAYLDIADAYMRGDWATAINPVWSPLYSWLLGPVLGLLQPSMRWEFAVVHLANFAVYLGTLACFEVYWRQLGRETGSGDQPQASIGLPDWAWLPLGYSLFVWAALGLIKIWAVTPDMLMAGLLFLACGLMLRIRQDRAGRLTYVLLGVVLGLAYLAKAVMFPIGLVMLGIAWLSSKRPRQASGRVAAALACFLLVCAPFISAISLAKGRLTLGEAGGLTYIRYVNGVPYPHYQGALAGNGTPLHPSRQILDQPPIYEFGTPIGGTYPISYDPSYWYEGVGPRVAASELLRSILASSMFYLDLLVRQSGPVVFAVILLYGLGLRPALRANEFVRRWGLAVVALAAFGLYGLVYVEGRYVGAFVVLFWGDWLKNARLPDRPEHRRLAGWISASIVALMLAQIMAFNLEGLNALARPGTTATSAEHSAPPPGWPGEVAESLHRLGVEPGDKVAVIGDAFDSYWARLARVQIVAEMLSAQAGPFWAGNAQTQARAIRAFGDAGATAIVAEYVPAFAALPGWRQVGHTNFYIYVFDQ
jgi:hypothetical protein